MFGRDVVNEFSPMSFNLITIMLDSQNVTVQQEAGTGSVVYILLNK